MQHTAHAPNNASLFGLCFVFCPSRIVRPELSEMLKKAKKKLAKLEKKGLLDNPGEVGDEDDADDDDNRED